MARAKGDTDAEWLAKRRVISTRYQEKHRHPKIIIPAIERFWNKVDKNGPVPVAQPSLDECWIWTGGKANFGYGAFNPDGRVYGAHRWIWQITHGPIDKGVEVIHACDSPPCVRISHLRLGTHADNMADVAARKRWGKPRNVPRGDDHWQRKYPERRSRGDKNALHRNPSLAVRGEACSGAKLSEKEVLEIRRMRSMGCTYQEAASLFGVSVPTVGHIVNRKTWRHI